MKKRLSQSAQREVVILGLVRAHKADRPPDSSMTNRLPELPLRMKPKVGQDTRDQVFDRVVPSEHLRPGKAATRKIRLQRLDQPTLVLGHKILLDPRRPGKALHLRTPSLLMLLQIQHRPERLSSIHRRSKRNQSNRTIRHP